MKVSKVKITPEAIDKLQEYIDGFSNKEHKKRFFSALKQVLIKAGWDVDVKRNKPAVMTASMQIKVNLLRIFLEQKHCITIPSRHDRKSVSKDKDVLLTNDIREDDRALFALIKAMIVDAGFTPTQRNTLYKRAHKWLEGKGWKIPPDFNFGLSSVIAVDRQCFEEGRDPVTLFYGSIQKLLGEIK